MSAYFRFVLALCLCFVMACTEETTNTTPPSTPDTSTPPPVDVGPTYGMEACVLIGSQCSAAEGVDFGTIALGESATATVQIHNIGNTEATLDAAELTSDVFTMELVIIDNGGGSKAGELPATIAGGERAQIQIHLPAGQASGALAEGSLSVSWSTDDGQSGSATMTINGTVSTCAEGRADCDGDIANGCETNTLTDDMNCGTCNTACTAVNGTSSCKAGACAPNCDTGYTGDTCDTDIDECTDGTNNCDANATCANTDGSFTCTCNAGYEGDGTACNDVDECATETDNCDANALCANSVGSFQCTCNSGFEGDGTACTDIDECAADPAPCDANAVCANFDGSFECACIPGYVGDGTVCTDIDECTDGTHNCDDNATCANIPGSYDCNCNAGYDWNTGGTACENVDECATDTDNCDTNAACTDSDGSFICDCNTGFIGDGTTCTDIDECTDGTNNCGENADCTNTDGSFTCACSTGYDGDGLTCANIDECATGLVDDYYTSGTDCYACVTAIDDWCASDWYDSFWGFDENCNDCADGTGSPWCPANSCNTECLLPTLNNCDALATCADTEGSFTCTCGDGYTGDGVTCTDVDECTTGTDDCDDNATCTNTEGSFTCECNTGYDGDGTSCADIDECADQLVENHDGFTSPCRLCVEDVDFECYYNWDEFCDACADGTGNQYCPANSCDEECLISSAVCGANETCTNTPGSYDCTVAGLIEDFEGSLDNWTFENEALVEQNLDSGSNALHISITDPSCLGSTGTFLAGTGVDIPATAKAIRFDYGGQVPENGIQTSLILGMALGIFSTPINGWSSEPMSFCIPSNFQGTSGNKLEFGLVELTAGCPSNPDIHLWVDNIAFSDDDTSCVEMLQP